MNTKTNVNKGSRMILGLGGEAGCGKSTTAQILCEKYGFKEYMFAENLKRMCMKVFNLKEEQVFTQEGKEQLFDKAVVLSMEHLAEIHDWIINVNKFPVKGNEVERAYLKYCDETTTFFSKAREVLQFIGTEICRNIYDKEFHVKVVKLKMDSEGSLKAVFSDARFGNERAAIREWLGFNIRVKDPDAVQGKTAGIAGHASETSLGEDDEYDFVLFNDKNLGTNALNSRVFSMIKELKETVFQKNVRS